MRNAFAHVALTEGTLSTHIKELESDGLIAGTDDKLLGLMWTLTPEGRITAETIG